MAQLYAWSNFPSSSVHPSKHVKVGDKMTKADLDYLELDDDQFQELLDVGAVRDKPYPVPENFEGSRREYALSQIAEMDEDTFNDAVISTTTAPPVQETADKANAADAAAKKEK